MNAVKLDPGLYTNVFKVEVQPEITSVMVASAATHPDLRALRQQIEGREWNCRVYQAGNRIFGYGPGCSELAAMSFQPEKISLRSEPSFCARVVSEGLTDHLKQRTYREQSGKGRITLYEPQRHGQLAGGQVHVYKGFDLRTIWWSEGKKLLFGLAVDVCWEICDKNGRRLSPAEIAKYNAMRELGRLQEELLPTGQFNTEVARLRLQNHILPFIAQICNFPLPCSGTATISPTPVRVILGG
ncbi:MAG: hypothetical protein AA908_07145 [Chlorobi bacterium NICIL-2]|nr:MAG: hypothetical protein AA908_07145 [Chlorobi bacterium NICIL-2]